MIRAAWVAVVAAMLVLPASAQTSQYKGICEDIFIPAYPSPSDAGTAIDDFGKIPGSLINKAATDCARRAGGFLPGGKVKFAHARIQALNGDVSALPLLRKLSTDGVPEAGYLTFELHLLVPQKWPHRQGHLATRPLSASVLPRPF